AAHPGARAPVAPRQFHRRVRHEAARWPAAIERAGDAQAEEAPDRLEPGARGLERLEQLARHHLLIALPGREEERPLAAEGAVEAPPLDAHPIDQVVDRRGLVALGPERGH